MAHKLLLALLLFYAVQHEAAAETDHTELCSLFKDGTNIRYPGSCTEYISCTKNNPQVYACVMPTQYDQNAQSCLDFQPAASENYCRNRCESLNGVWVADPNNCNGFYYCNNGVSLQGYCPYGHHFSEAKQMCQFDDASDCIGVSNICEVVPDGTKFRNEDDCSKYWQCSSGTLKAQDCKTKYFDVELNACADKTMVECYAHPLVSCTYKSGVSTKIFKGYKEDGATCRGYFHCQDLGLVEDLEPKWYQCPEGKFFSASIPSTPCVSPLNAVCTYNRCDTRGTMLIQSSNNDCHNFIECVDNKPIKETSCQGDMFFDEVLHACVKYPVYYAACDGQP